MVDLDDTLMASVVFKGQDFEVPEKINERRLLRLAKFAAAGADSDNMAAMGALDDLLFQCIRLEDQKRFDDLCDSEGASTVELFEFTASVIGALGSRPTERRSDSSRGPSSTPASSESSAADRAIQRWDGRPDLQIQAMRALQTG